MSTLVGYARVSTHEQSSAECVDDDAHERPACPRWQEGQIGDQSRFGRSR